MAFVVEPANNLRPGDRVRIRADRLEEFLGIGPRRRCLREFWGMRRGTVSADGFNHGGARRGGRVYVVWDGKIGRAVASPYWLERASDNPAADAWAIEPATSG